MSSNKETIGKTLGVVVGLCLVCAVLVSTAAVQLRPLQDINKAIDVQTNILAAAGIEVKDGADIQAVFGENVEAKVVNMKTGKFVDTDPNSFDFEKSKFDAKISFKLDKQTDIAGIQRMTTESPVYFAKENGKVSTIILPVQGYGLWGVMFGFIALDVNTTTVKNINFYKHNETPGLGGEIQNPKWVATWAGKQLPVDVLKGYTGNEVNKVDGLSGATLTSIGVDNTFKFWTGENGFGPFLAEVRKGALN
ncbi:Na(+)-translocating NADH-quinone reductase subunit C [Pseudoalteromonas sp. C2R02]|uniref:Na(+)-translocating NADH-quinone reductase subunit C n=1 Tax=Pseudoalteromonas sp. C2R02 TaxID=2841565 RepID=UPI001C09D6E2|nr:Na(+)-translocating NADH-quinone reductase subunit C [Pseudoalteromonas sp. C2R02]MBU2969205.1 Na(+)-translocating NADH-quinone reductase subunit C [Pseudoalteromonas sp. C2R02]